MKVLVVETTMYGYDGITSVIRNYYKNIDKDRVQMDLVTINEIDYSQEALLKKYGNKHYVISSRNARPIRYLFELIRILKKEKYEIIHVHGCSATMGVEMVAALFAGVKIRIAHSHNTKCDHTFIDKILRPIFYSTCNVRFACGIEAGKWLFGTREFMVINNGIDYDKFKYNKVIRCEMRKLYGLDECFVVGHVGRFSEQKNHDRLVDIFVELKKSCINAKLVLIGDGELKKRIEKRSRDDGLDILFVGESDEVEKWIQAMDVFVFPSLYEGLPLGVIEAQASGLPCVMSDTISRETKVTNVAKFVSLEASNEFWAETIIDTQRLVDRELNSDEIERDIQLHNYDIVHNAQKLMNKYEMLLKERLL